MAASTGSPASRRLTKLTPLTTRPSLTSRQGITRTLNIVVDPLSAAADRTDQNVEIGAERNHDRPAPEADEYRHDLVAVAKRPGRGPAYDSIHRRKQQDRQQQSLEGIGPRFCHLVHWR